MVYEWMLILVSPIILLFIIFAYFGVSSLFGKPRDEYDNSNQQKYNSYSHHEWGEQSNADFEERKFWELWQQHWKSKQQAAEDERTREFWKHFWKNYESEFRPRSDQKALDDETVEERRKHGDENFEESWEEFKEKFDQEDDENYAKYYKLLGIPTDATYDEVRKRFHKLVLKYHPDRYWGSKKKAAEKFKKIFEAHQMIMERMRVRT